MAAMQLLSWYMLHTLLLERISWNLNGPMFAAYAPFVNTGVEIVGTSGDGDDLGNASAQQ